MDKSMLEPPETPAPIFAFRAFKTALFGTPKQPEDENSENAKVEEAIKQQDALVKKVDQHQSEKPRPASVILSPSKPQGILMTPGTTTTHRKSVSFGLAVRDNEGKPSVYTGKSGLPQNFPGKFPSPWTAKSLDVESKKGQTTLTKSLYKARDQSSKKSGPTDAVIKNTVSSDASQKLSATQTSPSKKRKQEENPKRKHESAADADVTLDLNEPRSDSGLHWKSKYYRHHDRSKEEIRRLIKYKELARSYAKKKDTEKDELVDLLREERYKIRAMEEEISRLAGDIAGRQSTGSDSEQTQSGLVRQLARKTAETVEYKGNVDNFEQAIEGKDRQASHGDLQNASGPEGTQRGNSRSSAIGLHDMKMEMRELSRKLEDMTRASQELESENLKMAGDLSKAQGNLERSEKRRQAQEARHKQREARLEQEKQQLEKRLSKLHGYDRGADDVKSEQHQAEINTLKAHLNKQKKTDDLSNDSPEVLQLRAQVKEQRDANQRAVKDYKSQIERLTAGATRMPTSKDVDSDIQQQQRKPTQELRVAKETAANLRLDKEQAIRELHDIQKELGQSREQGGQSGSKKPATLKSSRHRQPLRNTTKSALNAAHLEQPPQSDRKDDFSYQQIPVVRRERSSSLESFIPNLPSPENSFTSTTRGARGGKSLNPPGSFSMALSHPQIVLENLPSRSRNLKPLATDRPKSGLRQGLTATTSSQQTVSTRPNLPPDRFAAAKARLEQRNAERKLASGELELQKENTRLDYQVETFS